MPTGSESKYESSSQNIVAIAGLNAALKSLPSDKQIELVTDMMNKSPNRHLYYSAMAGIGSSDGSQVLRTHRRPCNQHRRVGEILHKRRIAGG